MKLTDEELEGVLAHEMAHVQNLDVRLMTQRRWGLVLARAAIVGTVRFPLLDRPNEYLLVWTTTPWTLTS